MYKIIFFDIDGTLTSNAAPLLSDELQETFRFLQGKGVKIFISSGRCVSAMECLRGFPFDGYLSMNGSLTLLSDELVRDEDKDRYEILHLNLPDPQDPGKVYRKFLSNPMNREDAVRIADISTENNISNMLFHKEDQGLNFENAVSREILDLIHLEVKNRYDIQKFARTEDVYQFTVFITEEERHRYFDGKLEHVQWLRWHPKFLDAVPDSIDKGTAVKEVADYLHIDRSEVMAFGDGGNDVAMIRYAGKGVAMGNAGEDVKEAADYVTKTVDEGGVMYALRLFGLL